MQLRSDDKPLSFARFAKALSQSAPQLNLHIAPQTVKNWEGGLHCPNFFFTLRLADQAPEGSWQRAFDGTHLSSRKKQAAAQVTELTFSVVVGAGYPIPSFFFGTFYAG
jgi:hypothetical protein